MMNKSVMVVAVLLSLAWSSGDADPLAELAALGTSLADTSLEAGGSIRAKRVGDKEAAKRLKDPRNAEVRVEEVRTGTFPLVALKVKVIQPALQGPGAALKKNDVLVITPALKMVAGKADLTHTETLFNVGAYYVQDGDRMAVRVAAPVGKVYTAEYLERK
jgi:hypothetical protein